MPHPNTWIQRFTVNLTDSVGIRLNEFGFGSIVKPVISDLVKKSIRFTKLKPISDIVKPARIRFHLRNRIDVTSAMKVLDDNNILLITD